MASQASINLDEIFLSTLSSHIGDEWGTLGTHLGLRRDQMDRLRQDYTNMEDQIANMLIIWKRVQPRDVDLIPVLDKALRRCGRSDLAENIYKMRSSHDFPVSQGLDELSLRTVSSYIGNEWETLGQHLGLRRDQIERLKQDIPKIEDRVFDMLVTWRRMQPDDDAQMLAEALRDSGRSDLAQNIQISGTIISKKVFGTESLTQSQKKKVLPTTTSPTFPAPASANRFNLEVCQRELFTFYEQTMGIVQLLPWGDDVVDMDAIFVNLTLTVDEKLPLGSTGKTLDMPAELMFLKGRNDQRINRVLVKGVAGSGKSTALAKIAYDWAKHYHHSCEGGSPGVFVKRSILSSYKLLFILSLREMDVAKPLTEAIFDQILPEDTAVDKQDLEEYLESNGSEVLILLDGLDELQMEQMQKKVAGGMESLLANRKLRETCVVVTTRPHNLEALGEHQRHYAQVKLAGFSEDNIEVYVQKFFQGDRQAAQGLIDQIQKSSSIKSLAQVPVLLLMLCLLWSEANQLPHTYTTLYDQVILFLWKHYQTTFDARRTGDELQDVLLTLGKVALDGIILKGKLVFSENEFPQQILKVACRAGLLTKERLRSKLNVNTAVSFLHKSVQEYCAAYYWVTLADSNDDSFQVYLKHIDTDNLVFSQIDLLGFCCGMSEKAANIVLPHVIAIMKHRTELSVRIGGIVNGTSKDVWPIFRMLHESQLQYEVMHLWLEPLFRSKLVEIRQNPPGSLEYFHYMVRLTRRPKSHARSVLSEIRELKLFCGSGSLDLIGDTLDEMTHVETLVLSWETELVNTLPSKSEIIALSDRLSRLSQLTNITILSRHMLDISETCAGLFLGHSGSISIGKIELGNVEFDAEIMARAVKRQTLLKYLVLTNVSLTSEGADGIISQLPLSIQNLHLVSSQVGGAVRSLKPVMPSLHELVLREAKLQEEDAAVLADLLPLAATLKHLDLSWNNVGASTRHLASQLKHCQKLEILSIVNSSLSQEGAIEMLQSFRSMPQLTNVVFSLGTHDQSVVSCRRTPANNGFEITEAILRVLPCLPNLRFFHVKQLYAPKGCTPSHMIVTCLSSIGFNWRSLGHQQETSIVPVRFVLTLTPVELAKVKEAVDQYLMLEKEID